MTTATAGSAVGSTADQTARFIGVGLGATVLHYAIMALLTSLFAVPALAASQWGFITGGIISYLLNRAVTFQSDRSHRRALPLYILASFMGWSVNGGLFALLHTALGRIWPAQLGATAAVTVLSFIMQRRLVFAAARTAA